MHRKLTCFGILLSLLVGIPKVMGDMSDELIGYWTFDEGSISGTTVADSSGKGNDGIAEGDPTPVPGKVGTGALAFGPSKYITVDSVADDIQGDDITLNGWVKTTTTNNTWWFSCNSASKGNIFLFGIAGSTDNGTCTAYDGAESAREAFSENPVNDNQWHMLTYAKSGSTGTIFVDGVEQASHTTNYPSFGPDDLWSIGMEWDSGGPGNYFSDAGQVDEVAIWTRTLSIPEIVKVYNDGNGTSLLRPPGQASHPFPTDEAIDVPRDTVLSWEPGDSADTHDVYVGTVFDDVVNAGRTNPLNVLVSQGQNAGTYIPDEVFAYSQTYYWRVDEVSAPPESTIVKGEVWSFTVEPSAYPIDVNDIIATASSSNRADEGPENTINGSGLDDENLHSSENTTMWLSNITDPNPAWIQYEFDKVRKLYQMQVWNYNSSVEPIVGFGIKNATIEYSVDGIDWAVLGTTHEFAPGPGVDGYAFNTTVDLSGVAAKYIKITAKSNWKGMVNQFGLSEVRFLYLPVLGRKPNPDSGSMDVDVDAVLSWRSGREAARHDVYLSTDEQDVIEGTAPVTTVTESSYAPSLDLASTYYWRVDEVNEVETPAIWQGDIWSFSTQEYLVVDDFEAYNDTPAGEESSNLVYVTWIDGFDNPSVNGSTLGYTVAFQPSMETETVHSGKQSVPLFYDNTTAAYSEVTANLADLDIGRDWTQHGIKALTLSFYGDPQNAVNQQMYVKINGSKVTYDGDAGNLKRIGWQMWYTDLASTGASLGNVTELSIGFERTSGSGGTGVVLFDDIRLYPHDRQLITPSEPGPANLAAHWAFDEGSGVVALDASGNGQDGDFVGSPVVPEWADGYEGFGVHFIYEGQSVLHSFAAAEAWPAGTVTMWVKPDILGQDLYSSTFSSHYPNSAGFQIDVDGTSPGNYRCNPGGTFGTVTEDWIHLAVAWEGTSGTLYYNGSLATEVTLTADDTTFNQFAVGINRNATNSLVGIIDEFRVYNVALTPDEIAWLGGWAAPFDKPF